MWAGGGGSEGMYYSIWPVVSSPKLLELKDAAVTLTLARAPGYDSVAKGGAMVTIVGLS